MRSTELDLSVYDTDKVPNGYLPYYDQHFAPFLDSSPAVLEVGIHRGGSLLLWRDYFPGSEVTGIDLRIPDGLETEERVSVFAGSQTDIGLLTRVADETAPDGFDLIIDDASHVGSATKRTFWHLFTHHLKPGGIYAIEDYGTGYWSSWPDGRDLDLQRYDRATLTRKALSRVPVVKKLLPMDGHNYGMVGFAKQLVDEQAAEAVTRSTASAHDGCPSRFASVTFTPSIVFVTKAA